MKKPHIYTLFLLLTISCNTNKPVAIATPIAPAANSEAVSNNAGDCIIDEQNIVKENNADVRPALLKRTMRRPAVI